MRMRGLIVEYNLNEAAKLLGISAGILQTKVDNGLLSHYYKTDKNDYVFHEASIEENKTLLSCQQLNQSPDRT